MSVFNITHSLDLRPPTQMVDLVLLTHIMSAVEKGKSRLESEFDAMIATCEFFAYDEDGDLMNSEALGKLEDLRIKKAKAMKHCDDRLIEIIRHLDVDMNAKRTE